MEDRDEKRTNVTVNGTHCTLRDLQSATTYVIKVAAKTSAGVGVFGNLTASTTLCKYQSVGRRSSYVRRDDTSEISRDPRTKRLQTRRESLARPSKHTNNNF